MLAAAVGLAVALSRSPTPVPENAAEPDPLVKLLGFDRPARSRRPACSVTRCRTADPQVRGPREWLLLALHSRVFRFLSHPLVALGGYVVSLYGLYLGGLLGLLMRYHLGHPGHSLAAGRLW